jgi:hypothetical protein
VEFDALDDLTFERTGRLGRAATPEKLVFVRKVTAPKKFPKVYVLSYRRSFDSFSRYG